MKYKIVYDISEDEIKDFDNMQLAEEYANIKGESYTITYVGD